MLELVDARNRETYAALALKALRLSTIQRIFISASDLAVLQRKTTVRVVSRTRLRIPILRLRSLVWVLQIQQLEFLHAVFLGLIEQLSASGSGSACALVHLIT